MKLPRIAPLLSRRALLRSGLGLGVLAAGLAAVGNGRSLPVELSPARVVRIGFMGSSLRNSAIQEELDAFHAGMADAGWVEGQTVIYEYGWVEDHPERSSTVAADVLAHEPDVIVCTNALLVSAVLDHSTTVPVVMAGVSDPVGAGLIASLAHPGGTVTGTARSVELGQGPKRLSLLRELIPGLARISVLYEIGMTATLDDVNQIQDAARATPGEITVQLVGIASSAELENELDSTWQAGTQALLITGGVILPLNRPTIIDFAASHNLPSIEFGHAWPRLGGLMSYGPDPVVSFRRAAYYVDRVLRGALPADFPVEQATTFELVVNRTTARMIGVTIPPDVASQVTEWIE